MPISHISSHMNTRAVIFEYQDSCSKVSCSSHQCFPMEQFEHPHTVPADGAVGVEVEGHQIRMSSEVQPRPDDSPNTSGGSSDAEQREVAPVEQPEERERDPAPPKKKEAKISSKTAAKLSTSAKRIQKELAEITLDPPPNCRFDMVGRALSLYLTDPTSTITDLQRAVVSSISPPVSAAPSADGCTTQDYMHTDRYHDCP
ncbi:hypothetical protein NFI96_018492 [Prochilodus magdalenae]|nr:hypothetical protein NFI96_018492 [Prochilodus magdalenae]